MCDVICKLSQNYNSTQQVIDLASFSKELKDKIKTLKDNAVSE